MIKTVFVGLSGGVDSSVAAARLKARGYNVVGVFIKVWHPDWLTCNWEQERLDAMRVAARLDIPFLTCDAEAAYRDAVAHEFIEGYKRGITPNPDVLCNQHVKFGAFLEFARAKGADYIATGHYARTEKRAGRHALLRGVDTNKDQSYFLWTLTQEQLASTLLPVGDTTKDNIRREAEAAGLLTYDKKDSQGICFLGHIDIPEFLSHYTELIPGPVLNTSGEVIGEHTGALVYTLGQRHGFTISTHSTIEQPHYVVARDISCNTITVDTTRPVLQTSEDILLMQTNMITPSETGEMIEAQIRYRQQPFLVKIIEQSTSTITVRPVDTIERPAAGQSCVLYQDEQCLGGGIITA